jgi:hypothetical protein
MDDTLQRNRWQELAEKASVGDNPARLMKLVDELLGELNRLKQKNARFYRRVRIGSAFRLMSFSEGVCACQRTAHSGTLRSGRLRAGVGVGGPS